VPASSGGSVRHQARSYDDEDRVRISSLSCVAVSAALCAHIFSCGGVFELLEAPDVDAGSGGAGNPMEAGAAGRAGASGSSGGNSGGGGSGRAGAGGGAGADGGASAGRGGSAGASGSGGIGGASGRGGTGGSVDGGGAAGKSGQAGASGRGGTGGSVDSGGAAGSSGQADASRSDGPSVSDAFGRDGSDASVESDGISGTDSPDARPDSSEADADSGMIPCANSPPTDCAFCCTMRHPEGVRQYQQIMYGCACSDCYPQCAMSLCDTNTADPSVACLTCIRQRIDGANCAPGRDSCAQNAACGEYMSCAHACLPAPAP
jgi:hypothetical protein